MAPVDYIQYTSQCYLTAGLVYYSCVYSYVWMRWRDGQPLPSPPHFPMVIDNKQWSVMSVCSKSTCIVMASQLREKACYIQAAETYVILVDSNHYILQTPYS